MEQAKKAVLALGEESIQQAKKNLNSYLLLAVFLTWAMFAGACTEVGQTDDSSRVADSQDSTVQNQSRLSEEDTFRMGDEVEMKDNSGMRALTQDQRYAEDTERSPDSRRIH